MYKDAWDSFAREHGSFFSLIAWKELLEENFGYKSMYHLIFDSEGKIVGLMPLMEGRNLSLRKIGVSLPFVNYLDICCDDDNVINAVGEWIRKVVDTEKLDYIELRLKNEKAEILSTIPDESNYTFIMKLNGTEEEIMQRSTSDNRNHIRKCYKNNYFSVSYDKNNLDMFYKVFAKRQKQLGSPTFGIDFLKKVMDKLPENTFLLTVLENENKSVCGGMFLFGFGDTLYYQWGGSDIKYNSKYINNFMYWEAIKFGLNNGYKYLDFGRSPYDSGTFRFKKQWGTDIIPLKYCRFSSKPNVIIDSRKKYKKAIEVWKFAPNFVTNIVGKKLIKYVMP